MIVTPRAVAVSLMLAASAGAPVHAQGRAEEARDAPKGMAVSVGAEFLFSNTYVWRGFEPVHAPSLQPSLWVTVGDLTVSSWLNLSTGRPNGRMLTEHDLQVDYSVASGRFTWSAGWINYVFPDVRTGRYSNEFYGGVSWDGPVTPTVTVYQDVQEGAGTYVSAAVTRAIDLSATGITLSPSLSVGYNRHQWIDVSVWSDAVLGLELAIPLPRQRVTIVSVLNYSKGLARGLFGDHFYAAVGVSATWQNRQPPD